MENQQIEIDGTLFTVPLGDKECAPAVARTYRDVDRAIRKCDKLVTCVQAGGNFGVWAHYLSGLFDTVYTFEPHPENFSCLAQNCPQENIIKIQAGLGKTHCMLGIEGTDRNAGAHQMHCEGHFPILRIDDFDYPTLDLVTLDIEGMELFALEGGENSILKHKPVIMLEDKGISERYGYKQGDCQKWLEERGYVLDEHIHRDWIFVHEGA